MLRLYTFAISHFSEKARWALDTQGLVYEEKCLLPGAHLRTVRRLVSNTTVPVLVHDGRAIQESSAILDYLIDELGGSSLAPRPEMKDRARELEALADHAFGLGIQRIFYDELLKDRKTVVELWTQDGPRWGRLFYGLTYPVVASLVRRKYEAHPEAVERAKSRFRAAVDTMDACLAENAFLAGDSPTRLDITVASLLAPMCRPKEHPLRWPPHFPEPLARFVGEFERRPIYDHVLRMYREHRRGAKPASSSRP